MHLLPPSKYMPSSQSTLLGLALLLIFGLLILAVYCWYARQLVAIENNLHQLNS